MTMPASNINLITDVRNGFMQDSSGNASLNSKKYRQGAGKGTGNVALSDFANRAWSQGDDIRRSQQDGVSTVKPYSWDQGEDGWTFKDDEFALTTSGGLPRWGMKRWWSNAMIIPSANYSNCWFYCYRPGITHTWEWDSIINKWDNGGGSGAYVSYEYAVIVWENGYQSGSSFILRNWDPVRSTSGPKTVAFTPPSTHRYVQLSLRVWGVGYISYPNPELDITAYNMRVTV